MLPESAHQQSQMQDVPPCTVTPDVETGDDEKTDSTERYDEIWDEDPENPYNWSTQAKIRQVLMMASAAFTT